MIHTKPPRTFLPSSSVFYKSDAWKNLARRCKDRDGWTCTECNRHAVGRWERSRMHAHHIIPRPDVVFLTALDTLENLVCKCADCHQLEHAHKIAGAASGKAIPKMFRARRCGPPHSRR